MKNFIRLMLLFLFLIVVCDSSFSADVGVEKIDYIQIVLACALSISEALAVIPFFKSNSIGQMVYNVLVTVLRAFKK